ncbi:unnamed protein product [Rotaria socialis]|uniref:Tectonic-1-3 N-terminal domain-containing protein n=1 Tax=Rotaria socialis TaxID=392032 RepID=A0A818B6N7_9BILA|nr:unnamed protein product [Rotaria socialis]CAF3463638.1 unnamed protein product [Rotaria socialis]CAF3593427.1 unnamed protein product [Rotaria socialis]CAF4098281.1 unnamed protein product [Rotaria socialis]CAF4216969.1 unnamed protein product [Rotaria socialis]
MNQKYLLSCIFIVLQLNSNIVLSQRKFANPAVTDPAPCSCDLRINICDPNCCCDPDCTASDLTASPICNSIRTTTSYAYVTDPSSETWNCTNNASAALYDYFPFVCVQFEQNEIFGSFYPTTNATFINTADDAAFLRSSFVSTYPNLFEPTTLSISSSFINYSTGAPVKQSASTLFSLPGSLAGMTCQNNVNVLFGINQDFSCPSSSFTSFCTNVNAATSFLKGGDASSSVNATVSTVTATSTTITIDPTTEYYFTTAATPSISTIVSATGTINDYCPGRHPTTRIQRYNSACTPSPDTSRCSNNQYQIWSGCLIGDSLAYSNITDNFFVGTSASTDDSTSFSDFNGYNVLTTALPCSTSTIQRVFYRFNYSSVDNTISSVEIFVLFAAASTTVSNFRITIQWNDQAVNLASSTTVPRGYLDGEALQFRRNSVSSDVSTLVPTVDGLCVNAQRQILHYKRSTSSSCFVQLKQATVRQCHNLKLNMYVYLNTFYAPASDVYMFPNSNSTKIRNDANEQIELGKIDETRSINRLTTDYIIQTRSLITSYTIYDAAQTLSICFGVPSGVYIEFDYVRVQIGPEDWFEQIVSVQYNYTYSNWEFDCSATNCDGTTTQRYAVSFRSAFVDVTDLFFNLPTATKADLTSADNYIQHLLWLITPEYKGEPGYRNYTIAMILIFIAISVIVMHVLLFGFMLPF